MKKLRLIVAALLATIFITTASAQTGIGVRGLFGIEGNAYGGAEISLQKIGRHEWDLGWSNDSWKFTGLKLFNFLGSNTGGFGLYGGLGAGIGYSNTYDQMFGSFALDLGTYIWAGPIQVGLDWRPEWNVFNYPGKDVSFNLALSARLMFGKGG